MATLRVPTQGSTGWLGMGTEPKPKQVKKKKHLQ